MNIDELIANVKKKLKKNIKSENILIEDKTFLHKKHPGHESNKFHLKKNIVKKVFYPINDVHKHIDEIIKWLKQH